MTHTEPTLPLNVWSNAMPCDAVGVRLSHADTRSHEPAVEAGSYVANCLRTSGPRSDMIKSSSHGVRSFPAIVSFVMQHPAVFTASQGPVVGSRRLR